LTQKRERLFVRDATGLVKEFSTLDLLLMASCMVFSLQAVAVQFPWFYGFNPTADFVPALLIAAIPFVFLICVYWAAGVIMPRSGSDYVWTGRVFGPAVGFAWSAYYLLAMLTAGFAGSLVSVVYGLSSALSVSSLFLKSDVMAATATWLNLPIGAFTLSLIITIIFCVTSLLGTRVIKSIIYGGWGLAILGTGLMWWYLGTTNPTVFAAKWDSVLSSYTTYNGVLQAAKTTGWSPQPITFSATLISIPIVVLFLLGGNYVNAVTGEVKNIRRAVPISLALSLVFGIIWWSICSTLVLSATGSDWLRAIGYLWDNNPTAYNGILPFPPSMPMLLSLIAYPQSAALFLIPVAFVLGAFPTLFSFFWIPTRYFFAWSFDRILPSKMADVNSRFGTPHYAVAAMGVLSTILIYLFTFTNWSSVFAVGALIWCSSLIVPSLAIAAVPFAKKELLAQAPGFMKGRIAGVPTITILGGLSALSFGYMSLQAVLNPLIATVTSFAVYVTVGVVVAALIIYFVSLEYHKRQGLDLRLVFKEIPPE
jgi:APA family basic amino acid/polyamine antiporter